MYLTTKEIVKIMIDRIEDFEHDPEPQYDELLEQLPIHVRQQLKYALEETQRVYNLSMQE